MNQHSSSCRSVVEACDRGLRCGLVVASLLVTHTACAPRERDQPAPSPCVECHDADRPREDPDHRTPGFSTACEQCHDQTSWLPARGGSHDGWPLTGKHADASCAACHDRDPVPTSCVGCHDKDRQIPRSPNHLTPGFPTECQRCHSPSGWKPSSFAHDQKFPLEGPHAAPCTDCHAGGDFTAFSCVDCHKHRRDRMDHLHEAVPQYTFESGACYACHPRGTAP